MLLEFILPYALFFLAGIITSLVCNSLLLRFSQSLGIRNKNDVTIRWANESKPSLGGVAFFIAFIFGAVAYAIVFHNDNIFKNKEFVGLFTAGVIAFVMGLADDAYNTKPLPKLAAQIACGVVLALTGTNITLFSEPWLNYTFTIIWVVTIMNSLNMLDNMDGITGTTVLFILMSCLSTDLLVTVVHKNIWTLLLLTQIGAIVGFLKYNIHPSKLFMGDAGSQFIGLFVAFFSIKHLWNVGSLVDVNPLTGVALTLIAFTPTGVDTLTVVINRLRKGKSPMVGGKDHTTHHLVYAGMNDKQVWYVFLIIGIFSTLTTILGVAFLKMGNPWMVLFLCSYFVIVFILLYRNTIRFKEPKK